MRAWGKVVLAGLGFSSVLGVSLSGAAQAQVLYRIGPPVIVASDLDGPYDDLPPPRRYGLPPAAYGPPPVEYRSAYGPTLPVSEVYRILRNAGYSPLGAPQHRGNVITISVLDEDGEDGRLVIDAYSGRILRFVPAYSRDGRNISGKSTTYASVPLPKPRVMAALADKPKVQAPPAAIAAEVQPKQAVTIQPTQPITPAQGFE